MPSRLNDAVREFARTVINPFDLDALLHRVLEHAITTFDAAGAGIMLKGESGRLDFAAASSELVAQMEALQEDEQTGACMDAFRSNEIVAISDFAEIDRWPDYTARAAALNLASVVGIPLNAWGQTVGVLNVYRHERAEWTKQDLEACELLGAMAAGYILGAAQMRAQHDLSENLRAALESRGVIERAKGVLMSRRGLDAQAAFAVLREESMKRNIKLRDVAAEITREG